jgi:hypothetical protein
MNLWGVTPLLLVVGLIGGSGAAHSAPIGNSASGAAHHGANQVRLMSSTTATSGAVPDQASAKWSFATMTAALNQAARSWQVPVLVNTANGQCPMASDFWLETNSPLSPFQASSAPKGTGSTSAGRLSKAANICSMTVTFTGLGQIPAAAALVLDEPGGPASLQLSVSRSVPVFWYLGIPALAGVLMVVLLLALCMARVHVYDKENNQDAKVSPWKRTYWRHRIFASGAWTINDSWATNITAVVAVVGIILTTTSAVNSLFPGVALDRFAIVNACAGAIAAAAPLVFGALYAGLTHRDPGITVDATVTLPPFTARLSPQNKDLSEGIACAASLSKRTQVIPVPVSPEDPGKFVPAGASITLNEGTDINLAAGTEVALAGGSPIRLAGKTWATLSAGTTTTLAADTGVLVGYKSRQWGYEVPVQLAEATEALLDEDTAVVPSACRWTRILGDAKATLHAQTKVILPDGGTGKLTRAEEVKLSAGATAWLLQSRSVTLASSDATLSTETHAKLATEIGTWPAGQEVIIPACTSVKLGTAAKATLHDVSSGSIGINLPDGAAIAVPGGAAIGTADSVERWPVQVLAGKTIQVPPESRIEVLGDGIMALPGNPDVLVKGESAFSLNNAGGAGHDRKDDGCAITIAGGDAASAAQDQPSDKDKAPQSDVLLPMPTFLTAPAGAKITVTGAADLMLPSGTKVIAPRRDNFSLRRDRHIQLPQNSNNVLVANMRLAVISALVTIFGVGAEIGIVGVLAFKLSDASDLGQGLGLTLTILTALFGLWYSHTAIRALADPQPGSSISAASGSSFTL